MLTNPKQAKQPNAITKEMDPKPRLPPRFQTLVSGFYKLIIYCKIIYLIRVSMVSYLHNFLVRISMWYWEYYVLLLKLTLTLIGLFMFGMIVPV